ncbi:hypothetical protein Tsubulata_033928, partial [Turnera subulata]
FGVKIYRNRTDNVSFSCSSLFLALNWGTQEWLLSSSPLSFSVFFPALLNKDGIGNSHFRNCPPFYRGNLGQIKFHFTNSTRLEHCGPFVIDDCNEVHPNIQLDKGGRWYELENISQANTLLINDKEFQKQLSSNSYESFNSFSLPSFPYLSLQIISNLTLLKCKPTAHAPSRLNDIFGLLTARYYLEVHDWFECYKCFLKDGKCLLNKTGNFQCFGPHEDFNNDDKSDRSLKLSLGLCKLHLIYPFSSAFVSYDGKILLLTCLLHGHTWEIIFMEIEPNVKTSNIRLDKELPLTEKSDVYSFGVVLTELLSSKPAVDMTRERLEINLANLAISKILKGAFDELIDQNLGYKSSEEVKRMTILVAELAFLCLQQDQEMRPSMIEVFEQLKKIEGQALQNLEGEHHFAEVSKSLENTHTTQAVPLLKNSTPPHNQNL